jgi:hypothetical protein
MAALYLPALYAGCALLGGWLACLLFGDRPARPSRFLDIKPYVSSAKRG